MLFRFKQILKRPTIAIDLGTASTRMYACEPEMITEEPSIIRTIRKNEHNKEMDPYIDYLNDKFVQSPLRGGVVVDVNAAVQLLKPLFNRVHKGFRQPVSLACAPTDSSEKERKRLSEALLKAGASHVAIIPEPWAAAIGAGMDPAKPYSQMLVDIGEGVTDMAVFRGGRIVFSAALRTACFDIHKALRGAIISRHRVFLHSPEVESLTHVMNSNIDSQPFEQVSIPVKGMDVVRGVEASIEVTNTEIIKAMEPVVARILSMIKTSMRRLPKDISHEISRSGICLTGGGSCIKGMDKLLSLNADQSVWVAPDPVHAVINGAVQTLHKMKEVEFWWEKINWPLTVL